MPALFGEKEEENLSQSKRTSFTMKCRIPVGYRFKPNSVELLIHYLLKKVKRKSLPSDSVIECDLYNNNKEEWWELLKKSDGKDLYCFTKLKKKGHGVSNKDRVSKCGTWKGTQKTKEIYVRSNGHEMQVGSKRAFRFMPKRGIGFEIEGKVLMDEYQLAYDLLRDIESHDQDYVVSHIKYVKQSPSSIPRALVSSVSPPSFPALVSSASTFSVAALVSSASVTTRNPPGDHYDLIETEPDLTQVTSMVQQQNNQYLCNDFSSVVFCGNPRSQQDLARVMSMVQPQNNQYLCNDFSSVAFFGNPQSRQDLARVMSMVQPQNNQYLCNDFSSDAFCGNPPSQQDLAQGMNMVQPQNNQYLCNDFRSVAFCGNPQSQQDLARVMSMVQPQNNQYLCSDFSSDAFCGNPQSQQDLARGMNMVQAQNEQSLYNDLYSDAFVGNPESVESNGSVLDGYLLLL